MEKLFQCFDAYLEREMVKWQDKRCRIGDKLNMMMAHSATLQSLCRKLLYAECLYYILEWNITIKHVRSCFHARCNKADPCIAFARIVKAIFDHAKSCE